MGGVAIGGVVVTVTVVKRRMVEVGLGSGLGSILGFGGVVGLSLNRETAACAAPRKKKKDACTGC